MNKQLRHTWRASSKSFFDIFMSAQAPPPLPVHRMILAAMRLEAAFPRMLTKLHHISEKGRKDSCRRKSSPSGPPTSVDETGCTNEMVPLADDRLDVLLKVLQLKGHGNRSF